jgi:two-component system, NarL family, sensor kinase
MLFFFRFILLLFFVLSNDAYSQTHIIDSLKKRVLSAKNKEQKIKTLLELCQQKYSLAADSLYHFASAIKKLSQHEPGGRNTILADYYIAYSMVFNSMEDSSLQITNSYLEKLKDNKAEKEAYMLFLQLKGITFYRTNRSKETINAFYNLLNTAQQNNDTLFMLIANRGISLAYIVNGQDREGVKIFHTAMQLISGRLSGKYTEIYGLLHVNAAISYLHLYQSTTHLIYADSCEYYGNIAIETGRKTENLFTLCQGLVVTGVIKSYKKDFKDAEEKLKAGLEVRKIIGDTLYIISDMVVLASFYGNTKQVKKGVALCHTAIELAWKRNFQALLPHIYNALAENYKAVGQYKEYGEALKLQLAVKDSLNLKNSTDELKDLEIKYDLQKRENTIIQQKLNITKKNYWLYGSALFTVMAAAIFWLGFRNYRRKQGIKMELALAEEKRISQLSVKDAEEHERKRISKDLHDSLGAYANAVLYNTELLEKEKGEEKKKELIGDLKFASKDIITSLRETVWALKKEAYTAEECLLRVKNFIQPFAKYYNHINFRVEGEAPAGLELHYTNALNLVRIMQEAVSNSIKHASPASIIISSNQTAQKWKLTVTDDGKGFNYASMKEDERGNGLNNMEHRAAASGFEISIITKEKNGTEITINV